MPEANPEAPTPQGNPQARQKPLLTVPEQIEHLKSKGVTFDLCTEQEAAALIPIVEAILKTLRAKNAES